MIPSHPFYLIRHGESEANVLNVAAGGGVDSPLTLRGQQQADAIAPLMTSLEIRPSRIYHSPQSRAKETARRINRDLGLEMIEVPTLYEHSLGKWEGQNWDIIRPWVHENRTAPGGESRSDFSRRIKAALEPILTDDPAGPPLIVAHGGTFHAIGKLYEWKFGAMQNCHLHLFEPDAAYSAFPWQLWQFDQSGVGFAKTRSEFCSRYTITDK